MHGCSHLGLVVSCIAILKALLKRLALLLLLLMLLLDSLHLLRQSSQLGPVPLLSFSSSLLSQLTTCWRLDAVKNAL